MRRFLALFKIPGAKKSVNAGNIHGDRRKALKKEIGGSIEYTFV